MSGQTIFLTDAPYIGNVVGDGMFEANALFTFNYLDPGSPFDRMLQDIGWSGLRFPGGTVTEQTFAPGSEIVDRFFDVTRPSGLSDSGADRLLTVPAMFRYARENDITVKFTIPTENYLSDNLGADGMRDPSPFGLYALLDRVDNIIRGAYGEVDIALFQIGNEFWYRDRMSPEEYGALVNKLATGMNTLFDIFEAEQGGPEAWTRPQINMQATTRRIPDGNERIVEQMSFAARHSIDSVSTHYYPPTYALATQRDGTFDRLDDWKSFEGVSQNLTYFISEWNIQNSGGDVGLVQASSMLEAMRVMIERGVDHAAVWGTQYLSLGTRLAALRLRDDEPGGYEYWLTPAGETYRMMSHSIRGLRLLDLDTNDSLRNAVDINPAERAPEDAEQLVMHAYMGRDKAVIFVSSRSDIDIDVTLDPSGLIPEYHHVWAEQLGVLDNPATPDRDEGDPESRDARPYIQILNESDMAGANGLSVSLAPYEIVKFEFTTGDVGVRISGHDQVVDPAADYDDIIMGSAFDDLLVGNAGSDQLFGFDGDDTLIGGDGNDLLDGGRGDDLLIGVSGDNTLLGGEGNDTLVSGDGTDLMEGGSGANHFVIDPAGSATIADFDFARGDGLSFRNTYATPEEVLGRAVADGDDIVITHDTGKKTLLLGLGSRLDDLETVLVDFADTSPVAELVEQLNTPPPSGEIPPDPEPDDHPAPPPAFSKDAFQALLTATSAQDVEILLSDLSPDAETSLLDQLNPNALAVAVNTGVFKGLLANLSAQGAARLLRDTDQAALDMRFQRITAEEYANGFDNLREPDNLMLALPRPPVAEVDRIDYFLVMSEREREEFEDIWDATHPDLEPRSIQQILEIDDAAIEARRLDLLNSDAQPDFALFLKPGQFSKQYLQHQDSGSDDDDDTDQDTRPTGTGGGCFVATCAYGTPDHPDVLFLRLYRDLELSQHRGGRLFIRVYYAVGPWLADMIRPYPRLRKIARAALGRQVIAMQLRRNGRGAR